MAKKKTSKRKAQPKAAAPAKVQPNPTVIFKRDAKVDEALPPQAAEILSILKAAGKLDRETLVKKMEGRVKTRQPQSCIFSFYRKRLIKGGFITVAMA